MTQIVPPMTPEADFPLAVPNYERDVIYVCRFPGCGGLPTSSYFALKLETYLRLRRLPFRVILEKRYGPRNMIPWIELNGTVRSDSGAIIEYLETAFPASEKHPSASLAGPTAAAATVEAAGLQHVLEASLRWLILWHRWQYPPNRIASARLYFAADTAGLSDDQVTAWLGTNGLFQGRLLSLYYQGTGRRPDAEIFAIGRRDLAYVAQLLARSPTGYFFGQARPTWVDAMVFGTLENLVHFPVDSPLRQAALSAPGLADFCARIRRDVWQDYADDASATASH